MKRTLRIVRIWYYGKLPLAKAMKQWLEFYRPMYFAYFGKYPTNKNEVMWFLKQRVDSVRYYDQYNKLMYGHSKNQHR